MERSSGVAGGKNLCLHKITLRKGLLVFISRWDQFHSLQFKNNPRSPNQEMLAEFQITYYFFTYFQWGQTSRED